MGKIPLLSNITLCFAAATQVYIYTNFGDLLASESVSVAAFVGGLKWYAKPPKQRIFYFMMIQRAQNEKGLSFMHWIHCNRRVMLNLCVLTYNVFALLQNLRAKN